MEHYCRMEERVKELEQQLEELKQKLEDGPEPTR